MDIQIEDKKDLRYGHNFNDPIHGGISFTLIEKRCIDHAIFQRLRRIKQLGNVHFVFPSATHTRFSHSIGVMHVASKLFDSIFSDIELVNQNCSDVENFVRLKQYIRLAGLLHDIGHGPLSHHFESCLKAPAKNGELKKVTYQEWDSSLKLPSDWWTSGFDPDKEELAHEHFSYALIKMLGEYSNFCGQSVCCLLCDDIQIPEKMNKLLQSVSRICGANGNSTKSLRETLKSLLSSEIDADRIDYLLRDPYYCGVSLASIDVNHLLASIQLGFKDNRFRIEINKNAVATVENILISRKQMFNQVYMHRVNGCFDYLLSKAIEIFIKKGMISIPTSLDKFLEMDDSYIEKLVSQTAALYAPFDSRQDLSDNRALLRALCYFFTNRITLKRIFEEDFLERNTDDEDKSLEEVGKRKATLKQGLDHCNATYAPSEEDFSGNVLWKIRLKEFMKQRSSTNLYVISKNSTFEPEPLTEYSNVINDSNLWVSTTIRLVVYDSILGCLDQRLPNNLSSILKPPPKETEQGLPVGTRSQSVLLPDRK